MLPATTPVTATAPAAASASAGESALELLSLFRRVRTLLRQRPAGHLTASQASALISLEKAGTSSTTGLAALEGVRPQSMTATLNGLADLGLIQRHPDPDDGRRQIVVLTDIGRDQVDRDRAARRDWLARTLADRLDADELATVHRAMELLHGVLDDDS